jgi:hypothetical protein
MDADYSTPPLPTLRSKASGNSRRKLLVGLTIGVILLGCVTALVVMGLKRVEGNFRKPSDALTLYTDALIRKDYQGAYNMASPQFRADNSFDALLQYHAKLTDSLGALKSVKQSAWKVDTENDVFFARIRVDLQFERGSQAFQFTLRKEDGTWRVLKYGKLVHDHEEN